MNPSTNTFQGASIPRPPIPLPLPQATPFSGNYNQNPSQPPQHSQPPQQQQSFQQQQQQPFQPHLGQSQGQQQQQQQQQQGGPMLQPPQPQSSHQSFSSTPSFQRPLAPPQPPSLRPPSQQSVKILFY